MHVCFPNDSDATGYRSFTASQTAMSDKFPHTQSDRLTFRTCDSKLP